VCVLGAVHSVQSHTAQHPVHIPQTETHAATTLHYLYQCTFTDYFYKSVTLARLSLSSLRMVRMDQNM